MLTLLRSRKRSDPSVVCFVLQVRVKKPTHCALFCKLVYRSQLIAHFWPHFAGVIECWCFYWMCSFILLMNLMCFADHLNSLLLIFCSFSFILAPFILAHFSPTFFLASISSYLIVMPTKMYLIQMGDSNSKHFSFFVFYFNVSNKISSTPPRLLLFKNPPRLFQLPRYPLLLGTQE